MKEHKTWILKKLESWAETFNNDYPDHMEKELEDENNAYKFIHYLIQKYENNTCTKEDYENILFHLWQSNHQL